MKYQNSKPHQANMRALLVIPLVIVFNLLTTESSAQFESEYTFLLKNEEQKLVVKIENESSGFLTLGSEQTVIDLAYKDYTLRVEQKQVHRDFKRQFFQLQKASVDTAFFQLINDKLSSSILFTPDSLVTPATPPMNASGTFQYTIDSLPLVIINNGNATTQDLLADKNISFNGQPVSYNTILTPADSLELTNGIEGVWKQITADWENYKAEKEKKKFIDQLNINPNETERIGTFTFQRNVPFYQDGNHQGDLVVDEVSLTIGDGLMRNVKVWATDLSNGKKYQFTTQVLFGISSTRQNEWKVHGNKLHHRYPATNPGFYVQYGDVIKYNNVPNPHTDNFAPNDTAFSVDMSTDLKDGTKKVNVNRSTLNNVINIRVYSDLVGLIGDEPNGFLQTEAKATFALNTDNIRNRKVFLLNYFEPSFRYQVFKEEFNSLPMRYEAAGTDSIGFLNVLDFERYSAFKGGLKLNIFRSYMPNTSSEFHLNVFANAYLGRVSDTTSTTSLIQQSPRTRSGYQAPLTCKRDLRWPERSGQMDFLTD
jgi:hypothetical protein